MKMRHGLMIAGLSFAMGIGAFAAAGSLKPIEAKAAAYAGTVIVDTTYAKIDTWQDWRTASAKIGLYLFNNDVSKKTFLPVQNFEKVQDTYYINSFTYDLDWQPKNMIVLRMNSSVATGTVLDSWNDSLIWNKTGDLSIADIAIVAGDNNASETQSFATAKGNLSFTFDLFSRDNTHENHVMHGKKNVHVTIGNEFEISFGGVNYHELREGVSASFFEVSGTKIVARATGNFDFYFDTAPSGTGSKQLWVEENATEAAKAFATTFKQTTDPICTDGDNRVALAEVWNPKAVDPDGSSLVEKWNALTTAAKSAFVNGDEEIIVLARNRYIHIMRHYGDTVLGAFGSGPAFSSTIIAAPAARNGATANTNAAIAIISGVSVAALAGMFIVRKRKGIR